LKIAKLYWRGFHLPYEVDATVIEITSDFDMYGGEYTRVTLGYRLPVPRPPEVEKIYPPPPKPIVYKHVIHVFIPRDKWTGQYNLWQQCKVIIKDNGDIEVKRVE
jgi:hypothetical protein